MSLMSSAKVIYPPPLSVVVIMWPLLLVIRVPLRPCSTLELERKDGRLGAALSSGVQDFISCFHAVCQDWLQYSKNDREVITECLIPYYL